MPETAVRDLLAFAHNRSWRDVLDILVVAFLLYRLLLLIRGTRAVQLLAGMGVLAVIGLAASALHLGLTSWIFSNLAPALLIGVGIPFQPGLRPGRCPGGPLGPAGRPPGRSRLQLRG